MFLVWKTRVELVFFTIAFTCVLKDSLDSNEHKDIPKLIPKVTEWFNSNKLCIDKTVAMLFHTRQRTLSINECLIKIKDDTIPLSMHTKFLNVNIDNNLTLITTYQSHSYKNL